MCSTEAEGSVPPVVVLAGNRSVVDDSVDAAAVVVIIAFVFVDARVDLRSLTGSASSTREDSR
jgi:hypothetical protein